MKIVIGIPAFNEEKNIAAIICKLKKITDTIIVCDDGSSDLTGKISEEMDAIVVRHQTNKGYGSAINSVFEKAKEIQSDILVTFDADGQHRTEDIEKIIRPIIEENADIVIGSRFLENEYDEVPKYRKVGIKVITKLANTSIKEQLTDSQSGFRAYSKNALEKINLQEHGMGISTEILIKASKIGLKIAEIPIKIIYEGDTSTHNPISHGASVILSTLRLITIQRPLTFYGIPGLIFLIVGLFFVGWTIQGYSESGSIITNISLIGIGCTILGILLLNTATILHTIIILIKEKNE